ncbi:MAG: rod shape-determining protein MreC [Muribaculum sp.]|nr:rod shape-determining protein MreC [Muribaculum sp.]
MRNLLNFLIRHSTWFVFTCYVLISCIMLAGGDSYHKYIYLTSAGKLSKTVYTASNAVTGYFNLRSINESLQASNAKLENDVLNLQNQLAECRSLLSDSGMKADTRKRFDYILATVINNNTRHPRNYFTINRGADAGIRPGMGVVDHNGIVGIVNVVGPNTARVISVINQTQRFSVRIKGTQYVGSLTWRGRDPNTAYVEEIPRHAIYHTGDTVVTSGFSTTFPSGMPVGVIMGRSKASDDNYYTFKVRLTSDFKSLSTVRVIKDIYKDELDSLSTYDIKIE